jgi:hypothetical protein
MRNHPGTDFQHAMQNDLDRAQQSSVKRGLQLSQQEMRAPMATLSLQRPPSLLFRSQLSEEAGR